MVKGNRVTQETITWVSVNERLPACGINVLVEIDGEVNVARLLLCRLWKGFMCDLLHDTYDVTHWAEMPKGPSE